jgi:hypothetical protein
VNDLSYQAVTQPPTFCPIGFPAVERLTLFIIQARLRVGKIVNGRRWRLTDDLDPPP